MSGISVLNSVNKYNIVQIITKQDLTVDYTPIVNMSYSRLRIQLAHE